MAACMYCAGTGLSMGLGTGWVPCPVGCPPRRSGSYSYTSTRENPPDAVIHGIDQMIASFRGHRGRVAAGLSLNQAAKRLGLKDGYALARIERGEESPSPELADRMADLYGIDPAEPPESS